MAKAANKYDAGSIKVLEGLEPVRMRPGMYIGSTDTRGLAHLVWELMDNAVDEAQVGFADRIGVTVFADGSVEVCDNGRGIPVDKEPASGVSALELVMTKLHAGGKFDSDAYSYSGGLHGVGVSVVCALSERLVVSVWRDKRRYEMAFERGVVATKLRSWPDPDHPQGTSVRFWPDAEIFGAARVDAEQIKERCRAKAFLIPGLRTEMTDNRADEPYHWEWFSEAGLVDYLHHLTHLPVLHTPIQLDTSATYEAHTQVLQVANGGGQRLEHRDLTRTCQVQAAWHWCSGWDSLVVPFVNMVSTPEGGTHLAGFYAGLLQAINIAARDRKLLRAKEPALQREDIQEGLVAALQVRLPEPEFVGQTKGTLGTPQVQPLVQCAIREAMAEWLERAPKEQSRLVLEKIIGAARTRHAARAQRDANRKRSAIVAAMLPAKLADCRQHHPADSELLIVEGDSAAGPAKAGRDSLFQAVLPIRGKITNATRATPAKLLANAEVANIFSSLGIAPGRGCDLADLRISRVVILTDADADGLHIRCLLLSLFYHQARPMLEDGRVFYAQPPLFTLRRPGHPDTYAYTDTDRDKLLRQMGSPAPQVLRFKGLGEMDVDELAVTCLDPATRNLYRVTLEDAEAAMAMFEVLMGEQVEPRRDYIMANAPSLDRELLSL